MWRSRIFWRLSASYTLLLLAAIGLLGVAVLNRAERQFLARTEDGLRTTAVLTREAIRGMPAGDAAGLQNRAAALGAAAGIRVTVLAPDGRVLADSDEEVARMENHEARPEVRQARGGGFGTTTRYSRTVHRPMMYAAISTDGAGGVGFVRVSLPLERVRDDLAGLRWIVGAAAFPTGVAASILAFWLARRVTRRLRALVAAAGHIAAGGYGRKVYAAGADEVGDLARTFNHMSERLAAQFGQLEEDRRQLRTILAGMTEGVVALDAEQQLLFANDRACELLELPPGSAAGRSFWELVRHRGLHEALRHALTTDGPYRGEVSWTGAAARDLTVNAARIPGPPPAGVVLVFHDATDLRRLERVRREFVANVSHELKTPLSVIKVAAETLLDGAADDPGLRRVFLGQIAEQADRLHALILDLLSLAQIEAGTEVFEPGPVPLGSAVAACLERHRAKAEAKGQGLEAVSPPAGEVVAWADEEAVQQILDNLVDNALKYTPAGGRVWVRWRGDDRAAFLEVEDTGVGIPRADLPRVFERFYRVDKARSRELGGTGLGLAIVKHLAQAMGGGVAAASQPGVGSTFTVRLPRPPAA
jgi:two-component system phosphate regulon sensor histidine kinase PhoR